MAKGNTTVHATRTLLVQLFCAVALYKFIVVLYSVLHRQFTGQLSRKL